MHAPAAYTILSGIRSVVGEDWEGAGVGEESAGGDVTRAEGTAWVDEEKRRADIDN